jgi:hypothetical protein
MLSVTIVWFCWPSPRLCYTQTLNDSQTNELRGVFVTNKNTLFINTLHSSSSSIGTTTLSWVSACSTVVEHSQQEGFTECRCQWHVQPPTWRRTRDLESSNFRNKRPPASEATPANPAAEGGTMGEKLPRNFAESGDFHVTLICYIINSN